jgi:predicted PhzF superfamily epimerase YddE/YHI9
MRFFIVDAFTEALFGGNPAGVVVLPDGGDFPSDEIMRKTAAELRYSETAFVQGLGGGAFRTRYFTPTAEVELCGHATIAAFHALAEAGLVPDGGAYTNSTLAGDLHVEIIDGTVWMDMAAPEYIGAVGEPGELEELYAVMGLNAASDRPGADAGGAQNGARPGPARETDLCPEIISTGLPDIILPVAAKERLDAINPDFPALAKLSERYGVTGVHAFCAPPHETGSGAVSSYGSSPVSSFETGVSVLYAPAPPAATFFCRNFAPLYGIDEEAATGTANGALTYYLYRRGLAASGAENIFIQGEAMGRPSRVLTRLSADGRAQAGAPAPDSPAGAAHSGGIKISVGGRAVTLASGEIYPG